MKDRIISMIGASLGTLLGICGAIYVIHDIASDPEPFTSVYDILGLIFIGAFVIVVGAVAGIAVQVLITLIILYPREVVRNIRSFRTQFSPQPKRECKKCEQYGKGRYYGFHYGKFLRSETLLTDDSMVAGHEKIYRELGHRTSFICNKCYDAWHRSSIRRPLIIIYGWGLIVLGLLFISMLGYRPPISITVITVPVLFIEFIIAMQLADSKLPNPHLWPCLGLALWFGKALLIGFSYEIIRHQSYEVWGVLVAISVVLTLMLYRFLSKNTLVDSSIFPEEMEKVAISINRERLEEQHEGDLVFWTSDEYSKLKRKTSMF